MDPEARYRAYVGWCALMGCPSLDYFDWCRLQQGIAEHVG